MHLSAALLAELHPTTSSVVMLAECVPIPELDPVNVVLLRTLQDLLIANISLLWFPSYREQISPASSQIMFPCLSVKSVEEEEDGADTDHCAEDEGVPSLPQVDSLDQTVDGGETI